MKRYTINPNTRGVNGFGLDFPDYVEAVKFDGSAEATFTVPGDLPMGAIGMIGTIEPIGNVGQLPKGRNRYIAKFSYGVKNIGDVWVSVNATAAAPSTNAFALQAAELMPTAYEVYAGDVVHAQCAVANQTMSVALYHIVD
jgi:hypothetical protein